MLSWANIDLGSRTKFLISQLGEPRPRVGEGSRCHRECSSFVADALTVSHGCNRGMGGAGPCPLSPQCLPAQRKHSSVGPHSIQTRTHSSFQDVKMWEKTVCLRTNNILQGPLATFYCGRVNRAVSHEKVLGPLKNEAKGIEMKG